MSEALRLAELIEREYHDETLAPRTAAAELRRLHAENEALRADAKRYRWLVENAIIETDDFRHDGKDPVSTKLPLDNAIDKARSKT